MNLKLVKTANAFNTYQLDYFPCIDQCGVSVTVIEYLDNQHCARININNKEVKKVICGNMSMNEFIRKRVMPELKSILIEYRARLDNVISMFDEPLNISTD